MCDAEEHVAPTGLLGLCSGVVYKHAAPTALGSTKTLSNSLAPDFARLQLGKRQRLASPSGC